MKKNYRFFPVSVGRGQDLECCHEMPLTPARLLELGNEKEK